MASAAPGVERMLDLFTEFIRRGASVSSVAGAPPNAPWPQVRAYRVARSEELRSELDAAALLQPHAPAHVKAMNAAIDQIDNGQRGMVARDAAGRLIGIAAYRESENGNLHVEWLGTFPGHRGAGAALLVASAAACDDLDGVITLRTLPSSKPYYDSLGFQTMNPEGDMVLPREAVAALSRGMTATLRDPGAPGLG